MNGLTETGLPVRGVGEYEAGSTDPFERTDMSGAEVNIADSRCELGNIVRALRHATKELAYTVKSR